MSNNLKLYIALACLGAGEAQKRPGDEVHLDPAAESTQRLLDTGFIRDPEARAPAALESTAAQAEALNASIAEMVETIAKLEADHEAMTGNIAALQKENDALASLLDSIKAAAGVGAGQEAMAVVDVLKAQQTEIEELKTKLTAAAPAAKPSTSGKASK